MGQRMDVEDATRDNLKRFLGLLINSGITLIGLFADVDQLSVGKVQLSFTLKSLRENASISVCLRVTIFHLIIIGLCLILYYCFLRKWRWADFRLTRRAFGIVFFVLGVLAKVYGIIQVCILESESCSTRWILITALVASCFLLTHTIAVTNFPGKVVWKKSYAWVARKLYRLDFFGKHRNWEGKSTQ